MVTASMKTFEVFSALIYTLEVYTSDVPYGGTDAKIFVTFTSASGVSSPKTELTGSTTFTNPFEKGQRDVFSTTLPNYGPVASITYVFFIWNYNTPWILDRVLVL